MAFYEYRALSSEGKEEKGMMEADSEKEIRRIIRDGGMTPLSVEQMSDNTGAKDEIKSKSVKLKAADVALITRQVATLVGAGSPIDEALATASRQNEKKAIRKIMSNVRAKVLEGYTLADSLKTYPNAFSNMYRATVAAGESSGHLDGVLERLADYTESRQEIQQKVSGALVYPVVLTIVSILIVWGLLAFIVPSIVKVIENMGQELPKVTQVVLAISDFVQSYGLVVLLAIVVAVFAFKVLMRNPKWRFKYHHFLLKLPLISRVIRSVNTARFARTLSILSSSGVPILQALDIASRVVENLPMRDAVTNAALKVREGSPVYKALEQSGYFPPMTIYLIASGESSGKLDEMLGRAATQQERESDGIMQSMMSLFEPILILLMGGIVLVIVGAVLLPIFNLNQIAA